MFSTLPTRPSDSCYIHREDRSFSSRQISPNPPPDLLSPDCSLSPSSASICQSTDRWHSPSQSNPLCHACGMPSSPPPLPFLSNRRTEAAYLGRNLAFSHIIPLSSFFCYCRQDGCPLDRVRPILCNKRIDTTVLSDVMPTHGTRRITPRLSQEGIVGSGLAGAGSHGISVHLLSMGPASLGC